jgi:hypothetical protein
MTDEQAPSTDPRPTGRPNARMRKTVTDMIRSLVVVLVVIGAILLVTWRPQPDPVRVIDPQPTLAIARAQADYPVLAPAGLSQEWRPTSARWQPTDGSLPDVAWHLGVVTPDDQYVQIAQSATTNAGFIPEQTQGGRPVDGGVPGWQRYESTSSSGILTRSMVTVVDGVTVIVSGTADWPELEVFAASLSSA